MNDNVKITADNYEAFLLLQADGELAPAEEAALRQWMNEHPDALGELALYESLRLVPDETIVYENKDSLLKPLAARSTISLLPARVRFVAAAALLLFLAGATVLWMQQRNSAELYAGYAINTTGTMWRTAFDNQRTAKPRKTPVRSPRVPASAPGRSVERNNTPVRLAMRPPVKASPRNVPQPLPAVQLPRIQQLSTEPIRLPALVYENVPPAAVLPDGAPRNAQLSIPVASLLREQAGARLQQIRATANAVKDATVAVRIGNKDLFNIRF